MLCLALPLPDEHLLVCDLLRHWWQQQPQADQLRCHSASRCCVVVARHEQLVLVVYFVNRRWIEYRWSASLGPLAVNDEWLRAWLHDHPTRRFVYANPQASREVRWADGRLQEHEHTTSPPSASFHAWQVRVTADWTAQCDVLVRTHLVCRPPAMPPRVTHRLGRFYPAPIATLYVYDAPGLRVAQFPSPHVTGHLVVSTPSSTPWTVQRVLRVLAEMLRESEGVEDLVRAWIGKQESLSSRFTQLLLDPTWNWNQPSPRSPRRPSATLSFGSTTPSASTSAR